MRRVVIAIGMLAVFLAGCGGGVSIPKVSHLDTARQHLLCPTGLATMGCASGSAATQPTTVPPRAGLPPVKLPHGCIIPDTSQWQGHPAWATAKAYICGAVAKAGEGVSEDPDFAYSWHALSSLGLWHSSYWFVRNVGCSNEVNAYVRVLASVGYKGDRLAGPPVLDMETREAYGYAICLSDGLHRLLGVWPVIYTAPGTWPGGGVVAGTLAWPAAYGPSSPPCLPFTCQHYVAWQFASPPYVRYYIRGLGYQDESVNYTFTSLRPFGGAPSPPPRPHCFGPSAQLKNPACQRIRPEVASWRRALHATLHALDRDHCLYAGIAAGQAAALFHPTTHCSTLRHRGTYFNARIAANLY